MKSEGGYLMRRIGGIVLTVAGFLVCPCHLILTLPLLISLLAGTALGSFLSHNIAAVYIGAGIYFLVALAAGMSLLFGGVRLPRDGKATCSTRLSAETPVHRQESSALSHDRPTIRR